MNRDVRTVFIAIRPKDLRFDAFIAYTRSHFPWFAGIELQFDPAAERPRVIGGLPKLMGLELQEIDSALSQEFPSKP
jgi:hypothetical protein